MNVAQDATESDNVELYLKNNAQRNEDVIHENDYVLLKLPSDNYKVVLLQPNQLIHMGKFGSFESNELIGKYYSCPYEVYDLSKLRRLENANYLDIFNIDPTEETDANNQDLVDDSTRQKLTQADIEILKEKSLTDQVFLF
jgi:tRNA (adenine-N(1)-)-methyltransferase non-catalytic subunit